MATDIKALGDQIVGLTLLEAKALEPRLWLTTLKKPTASKLLPVAPS